MSRFQLDLIPEFARVNTARASEMHVLARLEFPFSDAGARRPPVHLALILDCSGSMAGAKINLMRKAAVYFMNWLTRNDYLTVITYADTAEVLVPHSVLTAKAELAARIGDIQTLGGTNLSGGWLRGLSELRENYQRGHVHRAILLTDGHATTGITDTAKLQQIAASASRDGIVTSTVGFGADFEEKILKGVADTGGGRFHFVDEPESLAAAFQAEFCELAAIVAQNLELRIQPSVGIAIGTVSSGGMQVQRAGETVAIRLPDVRAGDSRTLIFTVKTIEGPASADGKIKLADVVARCDMVCGEMENAIVRSPLEVETASPELVLLSANPEVQREVWLAQSAQLKTIAAQQLASGEYIGVAARLREHADDGRGIGGDTLDSYISDEIERLNNLAREVDEHGNDPGLSKRMMSQSSAHLSQRGEFRKKAGIARIRAELSPGWPERVLEVVEALARRAERLGYNHERVNRIKLALRELLENALEHGCFNKPGGVVRAECQVSTSYASIIVTDEGPGFDYKAKLSQEQADVLKPGQRGRGLLLISRLADRVHFTSSPAGTRAEVVIHRGALHTRAERVAAQPRSASGLQIQREISREHDVVLLVIQGTLDNHTFEELEAYFGDLFGAGYAKLLIDLSGVDYISSAGAGVFMGARTRASEQSGGVVLLNPSANVRDVFTLMGLDQILRICQTKEEAFEFF
ncbi:MAG TPA: anti-sigma factor antagonist [Planctomycetota bacterium]|nr:anti-sigma factor antagonist [Planctomycetota bacterium]